ncbi:MAG: cytochrome P450 [Actinomycetota bacterium]|nr:cytochrome P450 [Actinomycetota bacterium]
MTLAVAPASRADSPFDLGSESFLVDPWPVYAQLRAREPVHWSATTGAFVVLEHATVGKGLLDGRFTSRSPLSGSRNLFGLGFLDTDGPAHRSLRRAVGPVFGARAVLDHATRTIEPVVERVLASVAADEELDFVSRIATQVPYGVMAAVLGIPDANTEWLRERVAPLARVLEFPPGGADEALAAMTELEAHLREVLATTPVRRDTRTVLGALAANRAEPVDSVETLRAAIFLLVAGTETSVSAITNVMQCLLTHPDEMGRLWSDESTVVPVVQETLRWEPSTHSVLRFAREDAELDGVAIPRRSPVVFSIAAANRDPRVFADPERWDPGRPQAKAITFGAGPHMCAGLHLAQEEFATFFRRLRERVERVELAADPPQIRGHSFRRAERLMVRWHPRRR